jgi:hypothetical protein
MIVEFSELQRITRLKSKAGVRRYLEKHRIVYLRDGAPWTTTEAINRVLLPVNRPNQGQSRRAAKR